MKKKISLLIFLAVFLSFTTCQAKTLYLSVAASMTDAIKEVMTAFSEIHPEVEMMPNFASSGSLAKQISQGAPADIYISANPKWMDYLVENQLIAPGFDKIFAYNKLVFISGTKLQNGSMEDLLSMERIAIGDPKSVPAGRYAEEAMQSAGIYNQLRDDRKLILAKDVRQALLYADRGEVDGAFVYKTDALLTRNAKIAFHVPDDLYNRVAYPVGVTVAGEGKELAKEFYKFIIGDDAVAILTKYGFESGR